MIEIGTKDLLAAMRFAGGAVERRNTVPILDQLRIHANGALAISGTDLDMLCEAVMPYEGESAAPFMSGDWRRLSAALGHAGGGQVWIDPGQPVILAGDAEIRVKDALHADDWPMIGEIAEEHWCGMLGQRELVLLARVAAAMSDEETRYYLNGIYLHALDDWTVRAVATDGHRLAVADLKMPGMAGLLGDGTDRGGVLIPRKAVNLLLKDWRKVPEISLRVGSAAPSNAVTDTAPSRVSTRIAFTGVAGGAVLGGVVLRMLTKAIDGTFPDYARVIPRSNRIAVSFDVAAMRRAVQMLSVMAPNRHFQAIKLELQAGRMMVSGAFDGMAGEVPVPCESTAKPGLTIGFNGRYLLAALAGVPGETVTVQLADANAPSIWRDPSETDFFSVLMPMRV